MLSRILQPHPIDGPPHQIKFPLNTLSIDRFIAVISWNSKPSDYSVQADVVVVVVSGGGGVSYCLDYCWYPCLGIVEFPLCIVFWLAWNVSQRMTHLELLRYFVHHQRETNRIARILYGCDCVYGHRFIDPLSDWPNSFCALVENTPFVIRCGSACKIPNSEGNLSVQDHEEAFFWLAFNH